MICNLSNASVNKVKKCRECTFKMLCGGKCRVQVVLTEDYTQKIKTVK